MEIDLGEYKLASDDRQYKVMKRSGVNKETGEPTYIYVGYFISLSAALRKLQMLNVSGPEITTVAQLNDTVTNFIMQVSIGMANNGN